MTELIKAYRLMVSEKGTANFPDAAHGFGQALMDVLDNPPKGCGPSDMTGEWPGIVCDPSDLNTAGAIYWHSGELSCTGIGIVDGKVSDHANCGVILSPEQAEWHAAQTFRHLLDEAGIKERDAYNRALIAEGAYE